MASDGGPGTHCRRWARTKGGVDSTGALAIVRECGFGRELLISNDAVLKERSGGGDRRRKSPWRLRGTCSTTRELGITPRDN